MKDTKAHPDDVIREICKLVNSSGYGLSIDSYIELISNEPIEFGFDISKHKYSGLKS